MSFRLIATAILVLFAGATASAQGIRCSAFLHQSDGSWRSFREGTVLGPRGPIAIETGERFSQGDRSAKGDIARALDGLCRER